MGEAKWIVFVLTKEGEKTDIWRVCTKEGMQSLGLIKWFSSWRKYAFFPVAGTVYEPTCLRDIAEFIEAAMRQRKAMRRRGV